MQVKAGTGGYVLHFPAWLLESPLLVPCSISARGRYWCKYFAIVVQPKKYLVYLVLVP